MLVRAGGLPSPASQLPRAVRPPAAALGEAVSACVYTS